MVRHIFSLRMMWYIAWALLFAVICPIAAVSANFTDIQKYQYMLFGANVVYSVIAGFWAGRRHHGWFFVLLFPLIFAIAAGHFFSDFTRYFAVVYLLFTLLAYGTTR